MLEKQISKNDVDSPLVKHTPLPRDMESPEFPVSVIRGRSEVWRHILLIPGKYVRQL